MRHACVHNIPCMLCVGNNSIDRTSDQKVVFFPPSFLSKKVALSVFLFCKVYRQVHALFMHLRIRNIYMYTYYTCVALRKTYLLSHTSQTAAQLKKTKLIHEQQVCLSSTHVRSPRSYPIARPYYMSQQHPEISESGF